MSHSPTLGARARTRSKAPDSRRIALVVRHANESSKRYRESEVVRDVASLLKDEEIDLVVITTPNTSHFEYARESLLAGKHVVVLGGGDPPSRRLDEPSAPPAHRAPADPPRAKTRRRPSHRRAGRRRYSRRRHPRSHTRPSRTTDGAPPPSLPAPAAPPADPQGEEFAPG